MQENVIEMALSLLLRPSINGVNFNSWPDPPAFKLNWPLPQKRCFLLSFSNVNFFIYSFFTPPSLPSPPVPFGSALSSVIPPISPRSPREGLRGGGIRVKLSARMMANTLIRWCLSDSRVMGARERRGVGRAQKEEEETENEEEEGGGVKCVHTLLPNSAFHVLPFILQRDVHSSLTAARPCLRVPLYFHYGSLSISLTLSLSLSLPIALYLVCW